MAITMPSTPGAPTRIAPRTERWLPHALIATSLVVVLPALAVWAIIPAGHTALLVLSVPLGMLFSLVAAALAAAVWKRMPGSRDMVFADLMLWGWLRRVRTERRLARAEALLGDGAEGLSVEALTRLSTLLEARDSYTFGHSQRVTRHAERIATEMGLSDAVVAQVRTAAALHDVGKLHTPRAILNKPGRLTEEEFEVIRRHPGDGAAMVTGLGDPIITAMIRHHHERLDGHGYPGGLAGDAIPLGARIIAVADTFDAMTSNRAYRRASTHKRALDVLRAESGKQLDAEAVACFLGYYRGRRTVAWSAFATAAPQRFFAWLGSASPGIGAGAAGAAGAASLAIGLAEPATPVVTPAAAMERQVSQRDAASARPPARGRIAPRDPRGSAPAGSETGAPQPRSGRSPSQRSKPRRSKRPGRKRAHHPSTPTSAGNGTTAKPVKVKPQTGKPVKVKPPKATPQAVKPPKVVKPEKVKPKDVALPTAKPPKEVAPAKPQDVAPAAVKPDKGKP